MERNLKQWVNPNYNSQNSRWKKSCSGAFHEQEKGRKDSQKTSLGKERKDRKYFPVFRQRTKKIQLTGSGEVETRRSCGWLCRIPRALLYFSRPSVGWEPRFVQELPTRYQTVFCWLDYFINCPNCSPKWRDKFIINPKSRSKHCHPLGLIPFSPRSDPHEVTSELVLLLELKLEWVWVHLRNLLIHE